MGRDVDSVKSLFVLREADGALEPLRLPYVGRLNCSEVMGARPKYRNAPGPELGRFPFGEGRDSR
jgi:hypothetical protein